MVAQGGAAAGATPAGTLDPGAGPSARLGETPLRQERVLQGGQADTVARLAAQPVAGVLLGSPRVSRVESTIGRDGGPARDLAAEPHHGVVHRVDDALLHGDD